MKRIFMLGIVLFGVAFSVSGQGFYFDIGLGLGQAWTKLNGNDVADAFNSAGVKVDEVAVELGLRAGYGMLLGNAPIYVIGELGGIGHRIYDNSGYMQFNSYIVGPGVILYPVSLVQLSAGIGCSFVSNQTDVPGVVFYDSQGGFAWTVSGAIDLGRGNHGCLVGIKYFNATNKLKTSNADQDSSMVSVFVRYAYRHRSSSGF